MKKLKMSKQLYIGFNGEKTVDSKTTKQQIEEAKTFELNLFDRNGKVDWVSFYNPNDSNLIFNAIIADREMRVDKKTYMADRPPIAILTLINDKIERLEYYEGHDRLELIYDIRSKELAEQNIEQSYHDFCR